jgi:vesicle transport protein SEC22
MVRLTLIARVRDGLPLAEGLDSDKDHDLDKYKQQAKVRRHELHARRAGA